MLLGWLSRQSQHLTHDQTSQLSASPDRFFDKTHYTVRHGRIVNEDWIASVAAGGVRFRSHLF